MLSNSELYNMLLDLREILLERIDIMQKENNTYGELLQRNINVLKQLDETIVKLENENVR